MCEVPLRWIGWPLGVVLTGTEQAGEKLCDGGEAQQDEDEGDEHEENEDEDKAVTVTGVMDSFWGYIWYS